LSNFYGLWAVPHPEVVWHYTSAQGLLGILDSGAIWSSDLRFLNDSQENMHVWRLATEHVNARWENRSKEPPSDVIDNFRKKAGDAAANKLAKVWVPNLGRVRRELNKGPNDNQVFVASFQRRPIRSASGVHIVHAEAIASASRVPLLRH
jgi:hypothetical protein